LRGPRTPRSHQGCCLAGRFLEEPMDQTHRALLHSTRRHFFNQCAIGLGQMALASLLKDRHVFAAEIPHVANPLAVKRPHFAAKAKNVIYLFMAGGPTQLELFEYKPKLLEYNGKPIPDSFLQGKRFAFMDSFSKEVPRLLGTRRQFKPYGQS